MDRKQIFKLTFVSRVVYVWKVLSVLVVIYRIHITSKVNGHNKKNHTQVHTTHTHTHRTTTTTTITRIKARKREITLNQYQKISWSIRGMYKIEKGRDRMDFTKKQHNDDTKMRGLSSTIWLKGGGDDIWHQRGTIGPPNGRHWRTKWKKFLCLKEQWIWMQQL